VWLLGLPGDWLLDDYSLPGLEFPSLLKPRALSYLTFWLNLEWFGPTPWAFRLTNILLHAAAVQFCYRAMRKLVGDSRAFLAAGFFAVHPLQADAVLYAFNRPVVLMGLLLWMALDRWLAGKHWWTVGLYGLALAAKEEAIAFPLVLAALHFSISRNAREWRPIGVMAAMAIGTVGLVWNATRTLAGSGAGEQAGVSWLDYLATQPAMIALYLKHAVWPQFEGVRWMVEIWPRWAIGLWLLPAAALYFARRHFARAGVSYLMLAALLFLLPTSSVFPIADLAASRRMYLTLALLAAAPAMRWQWGLLIISLYAALGANWAITLYKHPEDAWLATMERQPGRVEPLLQYCKYVPAEKALEVLRERPSPANAGYQTELGRVFLELKQPAEALRAFGRALALEPGVASHVYNRGVALATLGQKEAAKSDFRRALEIDPQHKPARAALAIP